MALIRSSWHARRGDTARSPIWAVVGQDGTPIDVGEWTVRAQLREHVSSFVVTHAFTTSHGVLLGWGTVQLDDGRFVSTGTVQLVLTPGDWAEIPDGFTGVLDVELASDATPTPLQVFTLALVDFTTEADVTRWYDPDSLGPPEALPGFAEMYAQVGDIQSRVVALEAGSSAVFSVNGRTGAVTGLAEASVLDAHTSNTANPHNVTKAQVGLGLVDNTSDASKPLSTAASSALAGKTDRNTLSAKGDLYVASASAIPTRLGVGSDGQVLTADSSQTAGVRWGVNPSAPVDSVNGRTGAVTGLAEAADLSAVALSGDAADLTGTLNDLVIPAGITRDTELTAGLAGKSDVGHTHPIDDLAVAGTHDDTTFLRGDGTWAVPPGTGGGTGADATTTTKGVIQLAGDLAGTATAPVVVRRAPVGGVQTPTYAGTVTPDAAAGVHVRYVATGDLTVNPPTGGVDGQRLLLEIQGSGAARAVTFTNLFETSQAVPGRVFTVPSGGWAYFAVVLRGTTWRLAYAEPQVAVPAVPSAWVPADHGMLAWTADLSVVNSTGGLSANGQFVGAMLKLDQPATISNIICAIPATAGSGFTANTSYVGIYSAVTGALLASTPDQATAWGTIGAKTMPLTSPVALTPGFYLIALICTATTRPVFAASAVQPTILNYGRTTSGYRVYFAATTYTSLPATRPDATASTGNLIFFGLS